jgi:hypothetical protein
VHFFFRGARATGDRNLEISIKSMAMAAVELKTQPELLKQVKMRSRVSV